MPPKALAAAAPADDLDSLLAAIRACRLCVEAPRGEPLPHEPRPVLRASPSARLLIASQAPGTKVHATGLPFNDASGDRLRNWLGLDREAFYDERRVAIVPMGFCFPGQDTAGSDLPPRRECAPHWRARVLGVLPNLRLVLAIGSYAQRYHLPAAMARAGLTGAVARWREVMAETAAAGGPAVIPLPHPSWRNTGWLKRNPWFEAELVPVLRGEVEGLMGRG